jgi:hypothetical protein
VRETARRIFLALDGRLHDAVKRQERQNSKIPHAGPSSFRIAMHIDF